MTTSLERASDNRESDRIVGNLAGRVDILEKSVTTLVKNQEEILALAHRIEGGLTTAKGGWGLISGGLGIVFGIMMSSALSFVSGHFKWQ